MPELLLGTTVADFFERLDSVGLRALPIAQTNRLSPFYPKSSIRKVLRGLIWLLRNVHQFERADAAGIPVGEQ